MLFVISAYRLPGQAARLLKWLAAMPGSLVLVHFDAAAPSDSRRMLREEVAGLGNVDFLQPRQFKYATFDHVSVTLAGLQRAVELGHDYSHAVVLTGQCYPIKPATYIREWFAARAGKSVFDWVALPHPTWPDGGYNRVSAWVLAPPVTAVPAPLRRFVPKRADRLAIPKPSLIRHRLGGPLAPRVPRSIGRLFGGTSYVALARDHAEYVLDVAPRYVRYFRRSYIPDELFFQTILMNSDHAEAVTSEPLHLRDFETLGGMHPRVMTVEDLDLMAASAALFVRKVDSDVDPRLIDRIHHRFLDGAT